MAPLDPRLSMADIVRRNPYRLFFPLGIVAGLLGVGPWILWSIGLPVSEIKNLHVTLQSQGFLSFFVVGFLLTALPRFSGTEKATLSEILVALTGAIVFLIGALNRRWTMAHIGTFVLLSVIPIFAGRRLQHRSKELPASFLLLGVGLLHAFLGTIFSLVTKMGAANPILFAVGRQMIQVGFLLCMALGVTAKLAPFLMGYVAEPICEKGAFALRLIRSKELAAHATAGLLILASFFLAPFFPSVAMALRAMVVTAHLLLFARIGRPILKKTAVIFFFWISCWMIPLGLWVATLFPLYAVAGLHMTFIGGFSLMIFSFGMLVSFSHSGRAELLNGKLWSLKSVGTLIGLALGFRVAANVFPGHYVSFIHSASGFWVIGAALWLITVVPKFRGISHDH